MSSLVTEKLSLKVAGLVLALFLALMSVVSAWQGHLTLLQCLGALLASLCVGLLAVLRIPPSVTGKVYRNLRNTVLMLAIPAISVLLVQNYTTNPLGEKGIYPLMLLANMVFYYLIYLFLSFLLGSFRWGYTIATVLFMLMGIANFFVMQFRSSPIVPWDLFSIGTAASVANNYTYEMYAAFVVNTMCFGLLIAFGLKNTWRPKLSVVRVLAAILTLGLLAGSVVAIQRKDVKDVLGMDQTLFTPKVRYRNNGFLAAFLGNLNLIRISSPSGYSVEKVEELQENIDAMNQEANSQPPQTEFDVSQAPNIIIIMNEAFSDLQERGSFTTNMDYMPNFRKYMQQYHGGKLMVSVKGGNTANSEYEFLTGDTMAFLPTGSVVYQQYIRDNVPAIPSYLASLGYETTGIHPYLATGWERDRVYPLLGFQRFLSVDDFVNPYTLRNYVSDKAAYGKIIEEYENCDKSVPQFYFEVTMQNHSGYSKEYPDFTESVFLEDLTYHNIQTGAAEKYLTLIYESDKALTELMDYFEDVERPTIIVMFGDHQPSDYVTDVIDRITGYDPDSSDLKEAQQSYIVPYFIWDNFGLEMDAPEIASLNYFGINLLQAAGIPLTEYQEFLLSLQKVLPVVCGGAYVDANGQYYSYEDSNAQYSSLLNDYHILQYNHMTDIDHRVRELFTQPAVAEKKD